MTDSNCAICMEDIASSRNDNDTPNSSSDGIGSCVPCGHCFHFSCFEQWHTAQESMRRPVKCPTCNGVNHGFQKLFITFANKSDISREDTDSSDSDSDESSDGDEPCTNYNTGDNDETGSPKNDFESRRQTVKDAKANSKPNDPNRHRYYKRKAKRLQQLLERANIGMEAAQGNIEAMQSLLSIFRVSRDSVA